MEEKIATSMFLPGDTMDREAWRAIAQECPRVNITFDSEAFSTPSTFFNITCVREIIWKQNWGPEHSTEIIRQNVQETFVQKVSKQKKLKLLLTEVTFRLITFGFFQIHPPYLWRNGSILDLQISIVRILEASNQRSPLATKNWLSQGKAFDSWGTAIDSKYEHLSWAEEKKSFRNIQHLRLKWERMIPLPLTVIIIIIPA